MRLHQLKPIHRKKSHKRVGRGGKSGTYSGRGMKGQKSRAGKKPRPGFAGGDTSFFERLPKRRGVVGKVKIKHGVKISKRRLKPVILNLKDIGAKFKANEIVSPQSLLKKRLISKIGKRMPFVKILGEGEITKKIVIRDCQVSKQTKEKIKKTGGSV